MPWKDSSIVDQRREFVLRALDERANISALCREYRISRKTGYKWIKRFREQGVLGLSDQTPSRGAESFQCSVRVALDVVTLRGFYPHYGPRKIRALLAQKYGAEEVPSDVHDSEGPEVRGACGASS